MKSAAYDISKSKTEIERRGKELTEQARKEVAAVNAGIKSAAVYLDTVRDEIKRPAVEWEAREAERKAKIADAMDRLRNHGMAADAGSVALAEKIRDLNTFDITEDQFGDQTEQALMVAQYLGHSNTAITFSTYGRFAPDHLTDAAEVLDFVRLRARK